MTEAAITLVPNKPDAERAEELRAKLEKVLEPVCRVLDEAKAAGLTGQFSLLPDYRGRHTISILKIIKEF